MLFIHCYLSSYLRCVLCVVIIMLFITMLFIITSKYGVIWVIPLLITPFTVFGMLFITLFTRLFIILLHDPVHAVLCRVITVVQVVVLFVIPFITLLTMLSVNFFIVLLTVRFYCSVHHKKNDAVRYVIYYPARHIIYCILIMFVIFNMLLIILIMLFVIIYIFIML